MPEQKFNCLPYSGKTLPELKNICIAGGSEIDAVNSFGSGTNYGLLFFGQEDEASGLDKFSDGCPEVFSILMPGLVEKI